MAAESVLADRTALRVEYGITPHWRDRASLWLGACLALTIHAFALDALRHHRAPQLSGGGGIQLAAIEVAIVDGATLLAREKAKMTVAAARGAMELEEGDRMRPELHQVAAAKAAEQARVVAPPLETEALVQAPPDVKPEIVEQHAKAVEQKPKETPSTPHRPGGAAAIAPGAASHAAGPVTAAPGVIARYAAKVRAVLARRKPHGRGRRGTVMVTFEIELNGSVGSAQITTSSGNPTLDQAVLGVVANTAFPSPPTGMSKRQLTFIIPFRFE
jgi:protein TonB